MDRGCVPLVWIVSWLSACSSPAVSVETPSGLAASSAVVLTASSDDEARVEQLTARLSADRALTAAALRVKRVSAQPAKLAYDPKQASGLSTIQGSALALTDRELERLSELGFVVSASKSFPTMLYAYASLYVEDLPLYVSADSILDAVYRSYEAMLKDIEQSVLVLDLSTLIASMRSALSVTTADASVKRDVDLYLAVASSLLDGSRASPVAGAIADEIALFADQAQRASGHDVRLLFGVERDLDFSQFKPRGHYTETPELERYFRALIWLGRVDLRLIETLPNGRQVLRPEQLAAAMLLRRLVDAEGLVRYQRISATLEAFVGRSDAMDLPEIDALLLDLGVTDSHALSQLDPSLVAQTILDKGYGTQQIASRLLVNRTSDGRRLPLDRSFALIGQRYTVDAHVLSNVVHDVVPNRLMPNPLDAAYAVFGNAAAVNLLGPELDQYAGALESARELVDAHEPAYWNESLYTSWLKALRALSPLDTPDQGLPELTNSAAWQARLLNTQLASWAQLRHVNGLYAKQSYTVGLLCEYPDAYVEPYPAFFAALGEFAKRGQGLAAQLGALSAPLGEKLRTYFENLQVATSTLGEMAEAERAGKPFSAAQIAFVNEAVHRFAACPGPQTFDGWYAKLDYQLAPDGRALSDVDRVVADIHTQPTDTSGKDVGRILHIGTGLPRLLVMTAETCHGPRAYAGVVSSYYELTTENWLRLSDADWNERMQSDSTAPDEVSWTRSFVVRD